MNGQALIFGALWLGTASISICKQNQSKVMDIGYVGKSETSTRSQFLLVDAQTLADGKDSRTIERQMPAIRVWVIDAVGLDEKTLVAALDKAQVIFRDAGVRLIWLRCPAQANQAALNVCQADDTNKLFLRIVRQPANGFGSPHALGQAFSTDGGSQYATIFRDRVLAMVSLRKPGSEALVLGHVIAHELGHLLLGTSTHPSFGLMAAGWGATDLERAPAGLLEFSSTEAATMRSEVIRRNIVINCRANCR